MPKLDQETIHLLSTAAQFDVHRWSDYPEVNAMVTGLMEEIRQDRKERGIRIREDDKVWRHLKVVVLDLLAAHKLSLNPYRSISLNKNDYRSESRYRKLHLKYAYLTAVIHDLVDLGYLELHKGFHGKRGRRSRIRATEKLIGLFSDGTQEVVKLLAQAGAALVFNRTPDDETIILRDREGNLLEFEDTRDTIRMRANLSLINERLSKARIALEITDDQHEALVRIFRSQERMPIDFGRKTLHRVFNDPSFRLGGRFYGGWWQQLPRDYRKYITINHKHTVEIDYSGHHIRILYAKEGLEAPKDLYAIEGCKFDRNALKRAVLIVINSRNRTAALQALNAQRLGLDSKEIFEVLEKHFAPIQNYFYSDAGLELQYQDSVVAEAVMLRMKELGAAVLPIHDSFIVRSSYGDELWKVMLEEFEKAFGSSTFLKRDKTSIEEEEEKKPKKENPMELEFAEDDIEKIYAKEINTRKWSNEVFGMGGGW